MKSILKAHVILVAALVAAGAHAQEATPEPVAALPSAKSRVEVAQELARARADGSIAAVSAGYDFVRRVALTKTRADVQAEATQARSSGRLAALNGEAHDFAGAPRGAMATLFAQAQR